ncbi:MAG: cupin domain-containing protein [Solirubrobacteraceae bacterium]
MTRPNAFDADFSGAYDESDPDGYRCAEVPFGEALGGTELAVRLYELPPGQTLCPYHYEYVEEWLLVMVGEVEVRTPTGVALARAGELVRFPSGPDGAHNVWNDGAQVARALMFSSAAEPSVCVYPDSGKVGVRASESDAWRFRVADGQVPYFDGEAPPTH